MHFLIDGEGFKFNVKLVVWWNCRWRCMFNVQLRVKVECECECVCIYWARFLVEIRIKQTCWKMMCYKRTAATACILYHYVMFIYIPAYYSRTTSQLLEKASHLNKIQTLVRPLPIRQHEWKNTQNENRSETHWPFFLLLFKQIL